MNAKRTEPWVPVGHPDFKWVSGGADVQALWRKYGWTPPSERRQQPLVQPRTEERTSARKAK